MRSRTPSWPEPEALFLDFDGVLCDSLEECYHSSWLALSGTPVTADRPPEPPFDAAYRARFDAARPFVRSGEDYLVVHQWAASGRVPPDQGAFDADLGARGPGALADLKARLYQVREALLAQHRDLWLSWNPLFAGVAEALAAQRDNPNVWVLSTKKAEFIVEILHKHGAAWPLDRTLYTGPRKKLDLIAERVGARPSVLVDDQIDHLDFDHPSCRCRLALWGYLAPGSAAAAADSIELAAFLELIRSFPRARRAG